MQKVMDIPKQFRVDIKRFLKKKNKQITVSGFKKSKVQAALKKAIISGDVSKSLTWAVELHISNYSKDLWKIVLTMMSKHINRENPLLPILVMRHHRVMMSHLTTVEPFNNQQCRNQVAEIIVILALSSKNKIPTKQQVEKQFNKPVQYNIPRSDFITASWKKDDEKALKTPINNLAHHILSHTNTKDTENSALYWLYKIFELDGKMKKEKKEIICSRRVNRFTDSEWATDYMWIIWDILFYKMKLGFTQKNQRHIIQNLFQLFCSDYKKGNRVSKRMFLIHAILISLDTIPKIKFTQPIYTQLDIVLQSSLNINSLYKHIGDSSKPFQNHISPPKKNMLQNQKPEHPYTRIFMNNELYNDPVYNSEPLMNLQEDDGILGHLDKFFGGYF